MAIGDHFCTTIDMQRGAAGRRLIGRDGVKRWSETNEPVGELPRCAVRGLVRPGAMCGAVVVGGEFCRSNGECPHKVVPVRTERYFNAEG